MQRRKRLRQRNAEMGIPPPPAPGVVHATVMGWESVAQDAEGGQPLFFKGKPVAVLELHATEVRRTHRAGGSGEAQERDWRRLASGAPGPQVPGSSDPVIVWRRDTCAATAPSARTA